MKNKKLTGNLLLTLTALIWGISFIAQSKGVEKIPPASFNGMRSVLGGLVLLPVIAFQHRKNKALLPKRSDQKTLWTGGIVCGVLLGLAGTIQTAGMIYTSPGKSGFITALYMILIPIIGIFQGKIPSKTSVFAVITATFGMYFMCLGSSFSINRGDLLTFVSSFLFAGHILAIDFFSPKTDGVKLSCLQFFVAGIGNLIYAVLFETMDFQAMLSCALTIGYSGFFSCGIGYTLQIIGQKYTDTTSASIIMSLESVFAVLATVILTAFGWNLTGGILTVRELFGCLLMFLAILLIQLPAPEPKKNKRNKH